MYSFELPTALCNDAMIEDKIPINLGVGEDNVPAMILDCVENCHQSGGYEVVPKGLYCTDYSTILSTTVVQRSDTMTLKSGSYFQLAYQGSSWHYLSSTGGESETFEFSISCYIDLRIRPNEEYNNPPIALMISPIMIAAGSEHFINIPTVDADDDDVRCRFPNDTNECGDICLSQSLPDGTELYPNCTLSISSDSELDWYAVTIMVEDFIDTQSTSPLSKIPVQFLIHVRPNVFACDRIYLESLMMATDNTHVTVRIGETFTTTLLAKTNCEDRSVLDIFTISLLNMVKTPMIRIDKMSWSINIKWTPTYAQIGWHIFCAVATADKPIQSNVLCIKFHVPASSLTTFVTATILTSITPQSEEIFAGTSTSFSEDIEQSGESVDLSTIRLRKTTESLLSTPIEVTVGVQHIEIPSTLIENLESSTRTSTSHDTTKRSTSFGTLRPGASPFIQTSPQFFDRTVSTNVTNATSSPSGSSSIWRWALPVIAASGALLLFTLVCCCCCCEKPCHPFGSDRKRTSTDDGNCKQNTTRPSSRSNRVNESNSNNQNQTANSIKDSKPNQYTRFHVSSITRTPSDVLTPIERTT